MFDAHAARAKFLACLRSHAGVVVEEDGCLWDLIQVTVGEGRGSITEIVSPADWLVIDDVEGFADRLVGYLRQCVACPAWAV